MFLIRAIGLVVVLVGLILVGISGDNHRAANGRHIVYGATLMVTGVLVALFASQVGMVMGWTRP